MRLVALFAVVILLCCVSAAMAEVIEPIAMSASSIGGTALNQYTPGVEQGTGPNNIGLLIRTWGKVTMVDTTNKFFYIDDGSNQLDGSGFVGIRVSYDNLPVGVTIIPPTTTPPTYVLVTGISSTIKINNKIQPNILPRGDSDIQKLSL